MKHSEEFLTLVNDAKSRVKEIGIDDYKKMPREGHLLIDVREDNEWAAGHAAGAVHMSRRKFMTAFTLSRLVRHSIAAWLGSLTGDIPVDYITAPRLPEARPAPQRASPCCADRITGPSGGGGPRRGARFEPRPRRESRRSRRRGRAGDGGRPRR